MRPGRRASDDVGMLAATSLCSQSTRIARCLGPACAVALGTLAIGLSGVRGADYPSHHVRALVWEQAGVVWSNVWYAGHPTLPYSVLAPALMAVFGPFLVAGAGSVIATYGFTRLTLDLLPTRLTSLANYVFGATMLVNVVVGRAPFALGLAMALIAVRMWQRDRFTLAVVAAVSAPLVSPVAGAFLGLAASGAALTFGTIRRWQAVTVATASTAPIVIVSVAFGERIVFPFRGGHFVICMAVLLLTAFVLRRPAVRRAAFVAAAAATAVYIVPNPLGGNYVRLAQIVAVPLAVIGLEGVGKRLLVPVTLCTAAAISWSLHPGVVAAVEWWGDESVEAAYHQPLIDQVVARNADGRPLGRLEIPFTENHWESLFVAPAVPFARGWERQLDIVRNPPLYDPALTLDGYHAWLGQFGVRWIAIPDVRLDHAGLTEQRLLAGADEGAIAWLRLVWSNADWQLFEVRDYTPIVDPPASLLEQDAGAITIRTDRPAEVTIRYRYADQLAIHGGATVVPDREGWIVARLPRAGDYRLAAWPG